MHLSERIKNSDSFAVEVACRASPLSQIQYKEVLEALQRFYPQVCFVPHFVETYGDKDKQTSLRYLERTDFFTREIDQLQLKGVARIAIHSAKICLSRSRPVSQWSR